VDVLPILFIVVALRAAEKEKQVLLSHMLGQSFQSITLSI